jgi:hypothetical protein
MLRNPGRYYEQSDRPPAIIYAPAAENIEATARCLEHINERDYEFIGVVVKEFDEAQQMLDDGTAKICVVDQRSDLPPARTPRYEVVAEFTHNDRNDHHRPTRINRPDAAT